MKPITATLITYNEADRIEDALSSLAWADEIVVVDSGSTDETVAICGRFTDRILHRDWTGYVDQKNFALSQATHDWVFSLDADERVTDELLGEIQTIRAKGFGHDGYKIPRVAWFMGGWIRHGEWYPDYQLRLFDRRRGRWEGGRVHESVKVHGNPGVLQGEILHFTYRNFSDYLKRLDRYSSLAAADYRERGHRPSAAKMIANPLWAFLKGYIFKKGLLDGIPGLMVAVMAAVSVFFKHAKLFELQKGDRV